MVFDQALDDMIQWLKTEGRVGIYDAANITRERRAEVQKRLETEANAQVFFIESVCDDDSIIKANIEEVKITSPDYKDFNSDEAVADFMKRIEHYKKTYEPMDLEKDEAVAFLKLIDVGRQLVCNKVQGYMQTGIVYFLMNIHIVPRTIYISRHGESEFNVLGKIGGDSGLSPRGQQYARALGQYMKEINPPNLEVWTSTMIRTIETSQFVESKVPRREWRCLEEINAGICDGFTYEEIAEKFPAEFAQRDDDKYNYRYPRGESYKDIVVRLEPVCMELERAHNVLVIGHQAVLRCLLAYFLDMPAEELPYIKVPLHTVMKLTPVAYGCRVEQVPLNIDAVSTHRDPSKVALKHIVEKRSHLPAEEVPQDATE
eukprot:comp18496_c0_seq1/m.19871 comp18496_c0_seq1/g.19871  ORF comp18496_c0_seq1/g.19871 comp18496_c0_seq1/m.19871 type:complete len:373 (-) comp18496_c0_seq1:342-1460(-)